MYFIQEADKPLKIFRWLNIIKLQEDKIILPIKSEEFLDEKKSQKLAIKTSKILEKTLCNKIVVSKQIKKQEQYINYLYSKNIDIVDGKWLFEVLSCDCLDYILKKQNLKKQETSIAIMVNELTEYRLQIIKTLVADYKKVTIVTNHMDKFRKIEKQILEELGITLIITNNKKKSLTKTKIILNLDFTEELVNKYNLLEDSTIVNIHFNVKISKKRFNGVSINDYEIDYLNNEEFDYEKQSKFNKKDIYESYIYKKQPWDDARKQIKRDNVKIKYLLGQRMDI